MSSWSITIWKKFQLTPLISVATYVEVSPATTSSAADDSSSSTSPFSSSRHPPPSPNPLRSIVGERLLFCIFLSDFFVLLITSFSYLFFPFLVWSISFLLPFSLTYFPVFLRLTLSFGHGFVFIVLLILWISVSCLFSLILCELLSIFFLCWTIN